MFASMLNLLGIDLFSVIIGVALCYATIEALEKSKRLKRSQSYQKGVTTRKETLMKKKNDSSMIECVLTIINYDLEEIDFPTRFRLIVLEFGRHYSVNTDLFNSDEWCNMIDNARRGRSNSRTRKTSQKNQQVVKEEATLPDARKRSISRPKLQLNLSNALTEGKSKLKTATKEEKVVSSSFGGISASDILQSKSNLKAVKKEIEKVAYSMPNKSNFLNEIADKRRELGIQQDIEDNYE